MVEKDGEASVAGPEGVLPSSMPRATALPLTDPVHGEAAGTIAPQRVARSPIEREERVAVPAGAVADARALRHRPRVPDELSGTEQERIERRGRRAARPGRSPSATTTPPAP